MIGSPFLFWIFDSVYTIAVHVNLWLRGSGQSGAARHRGIRTRLKNVMKKQTTGLLNTMETSRQCCRNWNQSSRTLTTLTSIPTVSCKTLSRNQQLMVHYFFFGENYEQKDIVSLTGSLINLQNYFLFSDLLRKYSCLVNS